MTFPFREALELRGLELRRNAVLHGLLLGVGLAGLFDVVVVHAMSEPRGVVSLFAAFFGLTFGAMVTVRNAFPRRRRMTATIDAAGLRLDSGELVPPESIKLAKLVPKRGAGVSTVLELGVGPRGRRRIRLWLPERDATVAMRALGALPGERRTPFATMLPLWKRFLVPLGGAVAFALGGLVSSALTGGDTGALVQGIVSSVPAALFGCLLVAVALGQLRPDLLVGAEGYAVRLLGRERFVHFRDVSAVERADTFAGSPEFPTRVRLRSGKVARLLPVVAPDTAADIGSASNALFAHLSEAFHRYGETSGQAEVAVALAREGRDGRAWLSALDALVRGGGGQYRVAAIGPERLTSVARDPDVEAETRVAAAAALVRTGDDRHRRTVRVTAEACAVPELRDRLLAVAEAEDDDAMAAALDARTR